MGTTLLSVQASTSSLIATHDKLLTANLLADTVVRELSGVKRLVFHA
jgi:hypothetical protein